MIGDDAGGVHCCRCGGGIGGGGRGCVGFGSGLGVHGGPSHRVIVDSSSSGVVVVGVKVGAVTVVSRSCVKHNNTVIVL